MNTRGAIFNVKGMSPGKQGHYWRKKWANGRNHSTGHKGERLSPTVLFMIRLRHNMMPTKTHMRGA